MKNLQKALAPLMVVVLSFLFVYSAFAVGGTIPGRFNQHDFTLVYDGDPDSVSSSLSYEVEEDMMLAFTIRLKYIGKTGMTEEASGTLQYGTYYTGLLYKTYTKQDAADAFIKEWYMASSLGIKRCTFKAYLDYTLVASAVGGYPV